MNSNPVERAAVNTFIQMRVEGLDYHSKSEDNNRQFPEPSGQVTCELSQPERSYADMNESRGVKSCMILNKELG